MPKSVSAIVSTRQPAMITSRPVRSFAYPSPTRRTSDGRGLGTSRSIRPFYQERPS